MKENRWYIYQKERFPLAMYTPMILAFSFSAVSYSSIMRGGSIRPLSAVVAYVTVLSFFMLLRIADEHKDFEEDCRYRPYRAVPRGLVTLPELFRIGVLLAVVQVALALLLEPRLLIMLAVIWVYFFCMSKEFFCPRWLKGHMAVYMLSHMLIMPCVDMYAAACDFLPVGNYSMILPLIYFVCSSFFDGIVVELSRKLRAPEDEEEGVDTYSFLWGRPRSVALVLLAMLLSLVSTGLATSQIGGFHISMPVLAAAYILCAMPYLRYLKTPTTKLSKLVELTSGVWTIVDYLCLGVLPLLFLK